MSHNEMLNDILSHTSKEKLDKFIKEYAENDTTFRTALLAQFSPKPKSNKTKKKPEEDYATIIGKAFSKGSGRSSRGRYRGYYDDFDDYGFDAGEVSTELEKLLDKARYFIEYDNTDEAIYIAKELIETIPEHWDENFDYEGDVQVIYDQAIDILEEMMEEDKLSEEQKESLLSWYEKEIDDSKHEYVGLNTSLGALESHFSTVEGGLDRILHLIEQRIAGGRDYEKERAVLEKITLLEDNDLDAEADKTIEEFLYYPEVRKIKLQRFLEDKQYGDAIQLLDEGIKIAEEQQHGGTSYAWREKLLSIYEQLNDHKKIMQLTKEQFTSGKDQQKHYQSLKRITPKEEWPKMLVWILMNLDDRRYMGYSDLKPDIYVEHEMWGDLWRLCRERGIETIKKYEKYLRPHYGKEVFNIYHLYVQQQATITDKEAYKRVADMLIRMKSFEDSSAIVKQLVTQYRQTYKRRPYMMEQLNRVKV